MSMIFGGVVTLWLFETTTKRRVRVIVTAVGEGTVLFEKEDEEEGDAAACHDYICC